MTDKSLGLPVFSAIKTNSIEADISSFVESYQQGLESLVQLSEEQLNWSSLVDTEMKWSLALDEYWSPVSHLHYVADTEELRVAYDKSREKIAEFFARRGQNQELYQCWKAFSESSEFSQLQPVQQRIVELELRDLKLSGVALTGSARKEFRQLVEHKSQLSSRFSNNLLDATKSWTKLIIDEQALSGLPKNELSLLQGLAVDAGETENAYLLNLSHPAYIAVITYADDRSLREEMYRAFVTRASAQTADAECLKFDNGPIIVKILAARQKMSKLLGFSNYADFALETRMAESAEQVLGFLNQLLEQAKPAAQKQFAELQDFASQANGPDELQAWDIAYWSEKLRQQRYDISEELIRPYFPAPATVTGLFEIVEKLYNIRFELDNSVDRWHQDVDFYRVLSATGEQIAALYLDLYSRDNKRSGAWMDVCRSRYLSGDDGKSLQLPVAFLVCNFAPAQGDIPSLLSHSDVETLFHECGHCLHHLLTRIDYPQLGGINGVEWDAVELPSQILENWCWEKSALDGFAKHYSSGEQLPDELFARILNARYFQKAMQLVRQLEFALTDMRLHLEFDPDEPLNPDQLMREVHAQTAVTAMPEYNRMLCSFGHLFAGGYAAGYYSYLWAELLSEDAYSRFSEEGIFNPQTGADFRHEILEVGASRPALESFIAFRGREPQIEPLLAAYGIGK